MKSDKKCAFYKVLKTVKIPATFHSEMPYVIVHSMREKLFALEKRNPAISTQTTSIDSFQTWVALYLCHYAPFFA